MKYWFEANGESLTLEAERHASGVEFRIGDEGESIEVIAVVLPRITFRYRERIVTAFVANDGTKRWVHVGGATFVFKPAGSVTARAQRPESGLGTGEGVVMAPMPGQVRGVLVTIGETVEEGQPLFLLEAMKMEIRVSAPRAGRVKTLDVVTGQSVEREQKLGEIE